MAPRLCELSAISKVVQKDARGDDCRAGSAIRGPIPGDFGGISENSPRTLGRIHRNTDSATTAPTRTVSTASQVFITCRFPAAGERLEDGLLHRHEIDPDTPSERTLTQREESGPSTETIAPRSCSVIRRPVRSPRSSGPAMLPGSTSSRERAGSPEARPPASHTALFNSSCVTS
jgi:hypothetical protein